MLQDVLDTSSLSDGETEEVEQISAPDAEADPSTAEADSQSLLDHLTKELGPDPDDLPLDDPQAPTEAQQDPEKTPDAQAEPEAEPEAPVPDELTDTEMKAYTPNAQKRIRQLVHQRNEARQMAEVSAPLTDFIRQHNLDGNEVAQGLELLAAAKNGDYRRFLDGISPYLDQARRAVGEVLPPDLEQQVRQGYIGYEQAQELARLKAQSEIQQRRMQEQQERFAHDEAQRRQQSVIQAVNAWEMQQKASDPEYGRKEELIRAFSRDVLAEVGPPRDEQHAVQIAVEAKRRAEAYISRHVPQQARPTRPSASSMQSAGSSAAPKPSSLMDAVVNGLRQANGIS